MKTRSIFAAAALRALVPLLGLTQIIGYGTSYYAFPILVPAVAREFALGEPALFGLLSAGLLLGGLTAPALGNLFDRLGAARVMGWGSLGMAGLFALWAISPNIVVFGALTLAIEVLSFAVLYDAAFALLAQKRADDTRGAITRLTLIAGFASTLFWPLSHWLLEQVGWRGTQAIFAALHLLCAALHFALMRLPAAAVQPVPRAFGPGRAPPPAPLPAPLPAAAARRAFWLLALGFALSGMALSAITVHLVGILQARGLGQVAYLAAMVMGPSQVAVRLVDATFWRAVHPLNVALLAAGAIFAAIGLLFLPGPAAPLAFVFAAVFGAGSGLTSIVRGAVPVALFGVGGLGLRLGRLAAVRNVLGAFAPFLFAALSRSQSMGLASLAALVLALAGLLALLALRRDLGRLGVLGGPG